jgi:hypothetical protein
LTLKQPPRPLKQSLCSLTLFATIIGAGVEIATWAIADQSEAVTVVPSLAAATALLKTGRVLVVEEIGAPAPRLTVRADISLSRELSFLELSGIIQA